MIDEIFNQAHIGVIWETPTFYNDTFTNAGKGGVRPESDLATIVSSGDAAGVGSPNNLVIDMYFVDIATGLGKKSEDTLSGDGLFNTGGIAAKQIETTIESDLTQSVE